MLSNMLEVTQPKLKLLRLKLCLSFPSAALAAPSAWNVIPSDSDSGWLFLSCRTQFMRNLLRGKPLGHS